MSSDTGPLHKSNICLILTKYLWKQIMKQWKNYAINRKTRLRKAFIMIHTIKDNLTAFLGTCTKALISCNGWPCFCFKRTDLLHDGTYSFSHHIRDFKGSGQTFYGWLISQIWFLFRNRNIHKEISSWPSIFLWKIAGIIVVFNNWKITGKFITRLPDRFWFTDHVIFFIRLFC